jgi:hypothetical protein
MAKLGDGWLGLYLPEDEGRPCLLARDGGSLQHVRLQQLNRPDAVVAAAETDDVNKLVAEQFNPPRSEAEMDDGEARLRGEIRAQVIEEARRAAIEAEVREELGLRIDKEERVTAKQRQAVGLTAEPPKAD